MFTVIPLPALQDNYIWLIRDNRHAVVVDPGDAARSGAIVYEQTRAHGSPRICAYREGTQRTARSRPPCS